MKKRISVKTLVYGAGSLVLGVVLVALLFVYSTIDHKEIVRDLARMKPLIGLFILFSTGFHFWITALKWQLISQALGPVESMRGRYFLYTSLVGLVGHVLPLQLAVVTVRSLALRWHNGMPLSKGAATALYDMLFDILVLVGLLVPSLLTMSKITSLAEGALLGAVALSLLGATLTVALPSAARLCEKILAALPIIGRLVGSRLPQPLAVTGLPLLERKFMIRLFALSIVRYSNLVARSCLVVLALDLMIPIRAIAVGMPVVALSFLVALTPASLGIAEWSWVGILSLFSIPSNLAVRYAIGSRILLFCAVAAINFAVWLAWVATRALRARNRTVREIRGRDT